MQTPHRIFPPVINGVPAADKAIPIRHVPEHGRRAPGPVGIRAA